MESYTTMFLMFLSGWCMHVLWAYLVGLGQTVIIMRSSMLDCLLMMGKNIQSVYEINYIKYETWKLMDRDEKYIAYQKLVDERELQSMKDLVIRNFINAIPPKYNHLVEFHDWDSAILYIDKAL